ncbi:hypothetical protein Poli38472_007148 [Pythium oligandrum]|uniref:CREG-like beta-barrel domain-containing protein n=1 Tax=Pythium oligandrum TaxID=41045 RepID=A0A8K1CA85_PYTOL|nr:hypothetical protein Poli38472_007148 [Pythium oligandrum]|eukprot:TMW59003.1 hypothetical protein Poli38472_007148 [Pythium oligandrum]
MTGLRGSVTLLLTLMLSALLAPSMARLSFSWTLHVERVWEAPSAGTAAVHARQLVAKNIWATLSTLSVEFGGMPFGHIVSYSDGVGSDLKNSTGHLYFYLTKLDDAGKNLAADARASVSISMAQEGEHACKMDVEDPTCWKLTLLGKVVRVPADKQQIALDALFSKHPQMASWPSDHGFHAYMLDIEHLILLDFYGGAKSIKPEEYYRVELE